MITITRSSITRPADTTAYAANDLVADSTTAGSVTPFKFSTNRCNGRGKVTRVTLFKDDETTTAASFTVHLFSRAPTVSNGDNGALAVTSVEHYLGAVAVDMSSGAFASTTDLIKSAALSPALCFDCQVANTDGVFSLYGLLEVEGSYTPASGEVFTITLDIEAFN